MKKWLDMVILDITFYNLVICLILIRYTELMKIDIHDIELVKPDPERDAPFAFDWFTSNYGEETLLLMGNSKSEIKPSTLESETDTLRTFLELEKLNEQITWMIRHKNATIGAIWIELNSTSEIKAPSVSIMIGNKKYRGNGIGDIVMKKVIEYIKTELKTPEIFARHLLENTGSKNMLKSLNFVNDGEAYIDKNGLNWQNVHLIL